MKVSDELKMETNGLHVVLEDDETYRSDVDTLKSVIVTYENFPKEGITYKYILVVFWSVRI